jgi:hypothetical protein
MQTINNQYAFVVAICGTRKVIDYDIVDSELSKLDPDVIVTDGRNGARRQAALWGAEHGKEIVAIAEDAPDLVVMFSDGTEVDTTADRARDAGISVRVVEVGAKYVYT